MNEPLMHATVALASRCSAQDRPPTRAEALAFADEIARECNLPPEDKQHLARAAVDFCVESFARVMRAQLLDLPGWEQHPHAMPADRHDGELRPDGSLSALGLAAINGRLKRLGPRPPIQWETGDLDEDGALTPEGEQRLHAKVAAMDPQEVLADHYAALADYVEQANDHKLLEDAAAFGIDLPKEAARVRAMLLEAARTAPHMPWRQLRDEVLRAAEIVDPEAITDGSLPLQKAD